MNVLYQKKFLKDLALIPQPQRKKIEHFVFNQLPSLRNFQEVKGAEKMTGYSHYYKIRFGDYRLGFHFINDTITLERILNRKEIYRYFP
ncbi:MAG: type II toxin-antitoxin system RelE/ParE family toxin [Bacteroidia bacterium]|nr:type II toxin-antitoxin system RelE/ParE family toxin [Bacteroidia bacterium]